MKHPKIPAAVLTALAACSCGFVASALAQTGAPAAAARPSTTATGNTGGHGMPDNIAQELRRIGRVVNTTETSALYAPLLPKEPYADAVVKRDVSYGADPRNKFDIFSPKKGGKGLPILIFVPGGGFIGGDKHLEGSPFYDNIGVWAAANGVVGVNMNYRLAPRYQWPSGIEDITAMVAYLKAHAAEYGGDPNRIFICGHSAGGAHVADYVAHIAKTHAQPQVAGAILMSGAVYDLGDKVSGNRSYYGDDAKQYPDRSSLPGLVTTTTPLMVIDAELDPAGFGAQANMLVKARADAGKPVPYLHLPGHSHISEGYAIGTSDESLSGPMLQFIRSNGKSITGK
jgi:triacylglycerol lipase